MVRWQGLLSWAVALVVGGSVASAQWDPGTGAGAPGAAARRPAGQSVKVRVTGPDGKPVAGAEIGAFLAWTPVRDAKTQRYAGPLSDRPRVLTQDDAPVKTDEKGTATVPIDKFGPGAVHGAPAGVIVLAWDKKLVGQGELPAGANAVDVKLQPGCLVTGKVTSEGVTKAGRKITDAGVQAFGPTSQIAGSMAPGGEYKLFLPAGSYQLQAYARDVNPDVKPLTIEPGRKQMSVDVELVASALVNLYGKPAPELTAIKAWKNGPATKLADLKGKVVLLDFWGFWCGPCVMSMPGLIYLHETYKDKGLAIIGVHDDSAESWAQVDARLGRAKAEVWGGKDLPFLLALDGGGEVPIPGTQMTARGKTVAQYGIASFPTTLLIDKEGKIVDTIELRDPEELKKLAEMLGVGEIKIPEATTRPTGATAQ